MHTDYQGSSPSFGYRGITFLTKLQFDAEADDVEEVKTVGLWQNHEICGEYLGESRMWNCSDRFERRDIQRDFRVFMPLPLDTHACVR